LRVVTAFPQVTPFFATGSIPSSSTKKSQVSDPFSGSLASHQHAINFFAPG
jgi:hypothetical protein